MYVSWTPLNGYDKLLTLSVIFIASDDSYARNEFVPYTCLNVKRDLGWLSLTKAKKDLVSGLNSTIRSLAENLWMQQK